MEKKILIVDDDVLVREVFNLILKYSGYFVFLADNWCKAIEILEREKLDILLTDFRMPPIGGINNGIELIRFVKCQSNVGELVKVPMGLSCILSWPSIGSMTMLFPDLSYTT